MQDNRGCQHSQRRTFLTLSPQPSTMVHKFLYFFTPNFQGLRSSDRTDLLLYESKYHLAIGLFITY